MLCSSAVDVHVNRAVAVRIISCCWNYFGLAPCFFGLIVVSTKREHRNSELSRLAVIRKGSRDQSLTRYVGVWLGVIGTQSPCAN